jgi:hypothetical protein
MVGGNVGQLKPDTKYIYERADGVTYAREFGAPHEERFAIGWDYDPVSGHAIKDGRTWDKRPLHEHIRDDQMWGEIRRMARTDPGLQDLLERAIVYYNLKREHNKDTMWHPV